MKIALIINTKHSVSNDTGYGVENFTYLLLKGLLKKGHLVTLFASGDSIVPSSLFSIHDKNLYSDEKILKEFYPYYEDWLFIEAIKKVNNNEFDLIHSQDHNRGLLFSHLSKTYFIDIS